MTDALKNRQPDQAGKTQMYHPVDGGRGFQNFNPEDAVLPRMRLNGKTGFFEFNLGNNDERNNKLTFVPLFMSKSRVYFDPEENSSEVFCRSADDNAPTWIQPGFWPDDIPPRLCSQCPHAAWLLDDQDKRQPPACTLSWNFLAVQLDDLNAPFIFSVRGTSITAVSRMMTMLNRSANDLFSAEVTLGSIEIGEGMRRYFKMTFDSHRLLSDEEMAACEEIYEAYVGDDYARITSIMGGGRIAGNVVEDPAADRRMEEPQHDNDTDDEVPF